MDLECASPTKKNQFNMQNLNSCNSTTSSVSAASSTTSTNSSAFITTNIQINTSPGLSNLANSFQELKLETLPAHVKFELDQLELELLEGDITQKGYDKRELNY